MKPALTVATSDANRFHIEALVGGRTRWHEHIELVLGVSWDKLPLRFRREWWEATDYGGYPPESESRMAELLAAEQTGLENTQREILADTARAREFLLACWRQQPPLPGRVDHLGRGCAECLRPASPCRERCLRSMLSRPALDPSSAG
jgi:hypothetical protein